MNSIVIVENHVRTKILEPAVRGVINVLQACAKSGSVRKVVFTSSISTITAKDDEGELRSMVDESSIVPINQVWKTKPKGWVSSPSLKTYVCDCLLALITAINY